jgi:uncharacterized delta-60 repeat protein
MFDAELSPRAQVNGMVVQEDGKILIAGSFVRRGSTHASEFLRLNPDGRLDRTFRFRPDIWPGLLAIQPGGKILVSGGRPPDGPILRLNTDGTPDATFSSVEVSNSAGVQFTEGTALTVQPDGKVLFGGVYVLGGASHSLVRLTASGALDATFSAGVGFEFVNSPGGDGAKLSSVAVQSDGRILVTGSFQSYRGTPRDCIVRLNSDGSIDSDFDPGSWLWNALGRGPSPGYIPALALGPGNRIYVAAIVGGNGVPLVGSVVAIASSGDRDASFTITTLESSLPSLLAVQADGRAVVAAGPRIARLKATGGLDEEFDFGAGPQVSVFPFAQIGLIPNGKILIAGWFGETEAFPRNGIAQLYSQPVSPSAPEIVKQPPSQQQTVEGAEVSLDLEAIGYPPPSYQWYRDGLPLAGKTSRQLWISRSQFADSGVYSVTLSNSLGRVGSSNSVLTVGMTTAAPGAVDNHFQPEEITNALHVSVRDIAPLADGGLLAARYVYRWDGTDINEIVKYRSDGAVDPDYWAVFTGGGPPPAPPAVSLLRRIQLQRDQKLLVVGGFTNVSGEARRFLVRLNANGTVDQTFNPQFGGFGVAVSSIDLDGEDRILVAGRFDSVHGTPSTNAVRLLQTGAVDPSFDIGRSQEAFPPFQFSSGLLDVVALPNGQTLFSGLSLTRRLNADGSLDTNFPVAIRAVRSRRIGIQADQKIILAFSGPITIGSETRTGLVRLNSDGTLDPGFNPVVSAAPSCVAVQSDGLILVSGGTFQDAGGVLHGGVVRLRADGSIDSTFEAGTNVSESLADLWSIEPTADGKIWIAGSFDLFDGFRRQGVARLLGKNALRISQLRRTGSTVSVTAWTADGKQYHLEYKDSSSEGDWKLVTSVAGYGGEGLFVDPNATGAQRFYRLRSD